MFAVPRRHHLLRRFYDLLRRGGQAQQEFPPLRTGLAIGSRQPLPSFSQLAVDQRLFLGQPQPQIVGILLAGYGQFHLQFVNRLQMPGYGTEQPDDRRLAQAEPAGGEAFGPLPFRQRLDQRQSGFRIFRRPLRQPGGKARCQFAGEERCLPKRSRFEHLQRLGVAPQAGQRPPTEPRQQATPGTRQSELPFFLGAGGQPEGRQRHSPVQIQRRP